MSAVPRYWMSLAVAEEVAGAVDHPRLAAAGAESAGYHWMWVVVAEEVAEVVGCYQHRILGVDLGETLLYWCKRNTCMRVLWESCRVDVERLHVLRCFQRYGVFWRKEAALRWLSR